VRYESLPQDVDFRQTDLDATRWPVPDELADITVAIETIEHLENPRAFVRELVRITTPAGLIVLSTPNQLSLLSKLSLLLKNQFSAFQERPGLYPAHRTALLEVDLVRIARECGLDDVQTAFTNVGRIPGTPLFWPAWLGLRGRAFSDNVILAARKGGTRSE
jgi:SAM-dependent methyltransferase